MVTIAICDDEKRICDILSEKISDDGNSATVEVKSTVTSSFNEEPEESTKEMKLMKVDGKWKLHA